MRDREGVDRIEPAWQRAGIDIGTGPIDVVVAGVVGVDVRVDIVNRRRWEDVRNPRPGDVGHADLAEDVDDATPSGDEVGGGEARVRAWALAIRPTAVELAAEETHEHRVGIGLEVASVLADVLVECSGGDVLGGDAAVPCRCGCNGPVEVEQAMGAGDALGLGDEVTNARMAEGDGRLLVRVLPRGPDGQKGGSLPRQLVLNRIVDAIREWTCVSLDWVACVIEAEGEAEVRLAVGWRQQASQTGGASEAACRAAGRSRRTGKDN